MTDGEAPQPSDGSLGTNDGTSSEAVTIMARRLGTEQATEMTVGLYGYYQACPDLDAEEWRELKAHIRQDRKVHVPVVLDGEHRVIDGRHRVRIWKELVDDGVELEPCPVVIEEHLTEAEARRHGVALNVNRRHLRPAIRRQLAATELREHPELSDRSIAKDCKVSPTVVGQLRGELEQSGEIEPQEATEGLDGKKRRRKRATAKQVEEAAGEATAAEDAPALTEAGQADAVAAEGDATATAGAEDEAAVATPVEVMLAVDELALARETVLNHGAAALCSDDEPAELPSDPDERIRALLQQAPDLLEGQLPATVVGQEAPARLTPVLLDELGRAFEVTVDGLTVEGGRVVGFVSLLPRPEAFVVQLAERIQARLAVAGEVMAQPVRRPSGPTQGAVQQRSA